ncbi:glycosyltransferase family 4 protein [Patescibacteria group bacterium]|nr:glycosyltransferase family 4 protein [Patescibacteria group bacterium]
MNKLKQSKKSFNGKKITIVTPIFPPDVGGPASYVFELGQRLKRTCQVGVVGFCEGHPVRMKNVEMALVNPKKYSFFGRQWRLRKNLKRVAADADLMYVQGPVVVGVNALRFARKRGIPTIMKFVGDIAWEDASRRGKTGLSLEDWLKESKPDLKSGIIKKFQKWSFGAADRILVPSLFLKRILTDYYEVPEEKIELNYNAFDGERSRRRPVRERAFKIMAAGRLVPHKNIDKILEALRKLPENYSLDVYGNGPERPRLESLVVNLGLKERVRFFGNVPQTELLKAMEEHDLFVLYSSYEGLPHVVLEAFASRCPVIASDIPGTNEVAIDGRSAVLAAPENADRLAEAIRNLSWDKKQREFLSNEAIRLLKNDFSWDAHIDKFLSLV